MFLGEVDDFRVGAAEITGELMDEKPRKIDVALYQIAYNAQRNSTEYRRFECRCARYIGLAGEICTVAEVLHRPNEPKYLDTAAYTFFCFLYLAFEQTPQKFRLIAFGIYELVFLECMYLEVVCDKSLFIGR